MNTKRVKNGFGFATIVISILLMGCHQHAFRYQQDEGISLSYHQMQLVSAQMFLAAESNKTASVSDLMQEVMRQRGRDFFRCSVNSNFWICINPDINSWRISESNSTGNTPVTNGIIMYTPIQFISAAEKRPFFVGLLYTGETTNLTDKPKWQ